MNGITIISIAILPVGFLFLRGLYIISRIYTEHLGFNNKNENADLRFLRTILCVGSGGHTSEILRLVTHMDLKKYNPRLYVMADSDIYSEIKIHKHEQNCSEYRISKIPRSRKVNQPFRSTIFSTMYAIMLTIPVIYKFKPHVIFCNGPGTCIPICIVAFIMRSLYIIDCRIVFIESVCRVRTLSLTGKILQYFADIFVVQWPQLHKNCFRSKYYGRLT